MAKDLEIFVENRDCCNVRVHNDDKLVKYTKVTIALGRACCYRIVFLSLVSATLNSSGVGLKNDYGINITNGSLYLYS